MRQAVDRAWADQAMTEVDPAAVRRALEEILQSAPFRTSKQCQDMLRYVVEHSLRHEPESLRERVIGIEVFGRPLDYDTSEDPVVRIRAADIRKRLAQYYQNASHSAPPVHMEIPSGCYRAIFRKVPHDDHVPSAETSGPREIPAPPLVPAPPLSPAIMPPPEPAREIAHHPSTRATRGRMFWVLAALILILLPAVLAFRAYYVRQPGILDLFWSPVFASPKPVLIYAGANAVYRLSDSFLDRYRREHHLENQGPEFFVDLPPGEKIDAGDLVPVTNTTGDARSCALLVSLMTRYHRVFDLRYGSDISAGDLYDSPTILVGGFNNRWTLNITSPLRFVLRDGDRIEDTWGRTKGWSIAKTPAGETTDDYAVISRLLDLPTGRVLITVAGIGSFGTEAAAEFLTNPREISELGQKAPAGWQKKNMQIVLHTKVLNNTLDAENIVATQDW